LVGEVVEDAPGHRVAVGGGGEHHRREHQQVVVTDVALVHGDRDILGGGEAEVRRDGLDQRGVRAAAVAGPHRGTQAVHTDVVAAAGVAGDVAEREEALDTAVRADADGVDAGPGDDGDAPVAGRTGAQHGKRVVVHHGPGGRDDPGQLALGELVL